MTDVEIDKINKPYLPIAAGQLSKARHVMSIVHVNPSTTAPKTHAHRNLKPHRTKTPTPHTTQLAASVVVVASLVAGLGLGLLPSPFGSQALLWVLLW